MQELYPDFKPDLAVHSDNLNLEARAAADKVGTSLYSTFASKNRYQFANKVMLQLSEWLALLPSRRPGLDLCLYRLYPKWHLIPR